MTTKTMTKTKAKVKVKAPKPIIINRQTFTINPDKDGAFNVEGFVVAVQRAFDHFHPVIEYTRPLTVAELEAAEVFAHEAMTNRVEYGPPEDVPQCLADELAAFEDAESVSANELIGWASDVQSDAQAWVKIANDLLALRAVPLKKAA